MKIVPARGFTLIELMVSLALIALFSTLALPLQELTVKRGQEAELRTALRQIREALDAYKQAADDGHIVIQQGDSGYPKTLALLVTGVKDAKSPTAAPLHFLRRIPRDPFADPRLKPEETWGQRSYLSEYDQPRPGDDVYDVYSLSPDTGINGIPYRQW
ncbi:MAG: general secretion pathway protein GspG [Rhodocyclales bacterium GWA2_65_20]|nr:MAG: general secretion pathway protein GspG [Rhodocyclales bacterium GWA2_65_20]